MKKATKRHFLVTYRCCVGMSNGGGEVVVSAKCFPSRKLCLKASEAHAQARIDKEYEGYDPEFINIPSVFSLSICAIMEITDKERAHWEGR